MINEFRGPFRFLSNFYPVQIEVEGLSYPSVEHAYQASKCNNSEDKQRILACVSAGDAKRIGRTVTLKPGFEEEKLAVMENLLRIKFKNEPLKTMLLSTGSEELAEGNSWKNTYWGVYRGVGANHLGRLLMKIRAAATGLNTN